jgi:endonuclease YncB( thermonuclease family)
MRLEALVLGSVAFIALAALPGKCDTMSFLRGDKSAIVADFSGVKSETISHLIDCPQPNHHDGDALRCGYHGRSMRLYAIDAPEMPGACRPGRWCVPGDPYASRDHLASLTSGKRVTFRVLDHNRYGRAIV